MKKVLIVFAVSGLIMALATVKAEGTMNGSVAVKDIANESLVEDAQVSAGSGNYKFRIRLRDVNRAMHLDADQIEFMQHSMSDLTRQIDLLEDVSVESRQSKLNSILADNLASVRDIVDEAQLRAYVTLLNNELGKAGLCAIL